MKIEMCESLFMSWLRHVKQCQIVQINWKPSSSWELTNEQQIELLVNTGREYFRNKFDSELFGIQEGQHYSQILRQCEIDVLGIELSDNQILAIYAVDVAFHEAGLLYGRNTETIGRVIKKMLRAAMILLGYFGMSSGEIVFASPKVNPAILQSLSSAIIEVNEILKRIGLNFNLKFYANQEFSTHVISPVIQVSGDVADTSELFMRSMKLYRLAETYSVMTPGKKKLLINASSHESDEIKIGKLVRTAFTELFENNKIPASLVQSLMDLEYSKDTFCLQYPVLRPANEGRFDERGYPRYWSKPFDNNKYWLCNDWYERHRQPFSKWMKQFEE